MNQEIISYANNKFQDIKKNKSLFCSILEKQNDWTLIYILKNLWEWGINDDFSPILPLLEHKNPNIRKLVVHNLWKVKNNDVSILLKEHMKNEKSTTVRREIVSSIWRKRNRDNIEALIGYLNDKDPKVIIQAIRGLNYFCDMDKVKNALKKIEQHPNEIIKDFMKQINTDKKTKTNDLTKKQKHSEFPSYLKNLVIHWDTIKSMKVIPDESIHLTFTSPPYYNARDYSIYQSYEEYLWFLEETFKEIYRITKEWRFFVLNTSPIIIPRVSRASSSKRYPIPYDIHPLLVKMGWEFIDDIIREKPEASVKNRNWWFFQHRKPLAYKPNTVTECVMVYRKKTDKLIDWNIRQYSNEIIEQSLVKETYEKTNVWKIDPTFNKGHSAVFPSQLCENVIKYYSFVWDLIFDPFAWSWTVWKVAQSLNRNFLMTEIQEDYVNLMKNYFSWEWNIDRNNVNFIKYNDFIHKMTKI